MKTRCLGCMNEYESDLGICPVCGYEPGTPAESGLHMQPGSMLAGRYQIGKVIGYGGFGVTYIAWDTTLQQRVAIKEYLPSEFATRAAGQTQVTIFGGNKSEQFNGGLVKFVEEAKRLAQFQNQSGIVRVFDSFEDNNTAYIVMEYLDGETLTSYLEREGKIEPQKAIELLTPVIQSLEAIHGEGIIHRDIAPDNIMITKDGQVKLIDFGAARYATTSHSRSLTVIIKPGYSPEEQYRSRGDQGSHTDVYAVGAVLYKMVTGITPPDALERRAFFENKKKDILVPPSKNCTIDKNIENALLNAMNVRIEDRTSTAEGFLAELNSETPVQRVAGKIKAIDLMKWPLWAKIAAPAGAAAVLVLFVLMLTGKIGFVNNLVTTLTLGENMTRVPSVINGTVEQAEKKLEDHFLSSIVNGREISEVIPPNLVLRQGTDAGTVVERDTRVELYISAAPLMGLEEGIMPDVIYYRGEEAVELLTMLGAEVTIEEEYSDTVAEQLVIRSSVEVGAPLEKGEKVTLYVSKGQDPSKAKPSNGASPSGGATPTPAPTKQPVVTISRTMLNLYTGESFALTAEGGNGSYSWSSSNFSVVTVSGGNVTAVSPGSATITVSSADTTASCSVVVQEINFSLASSSLNLYVGDIQTIDTYGAPSNANISWSSSNGSVASVSGGSVSAVSNGSATITASFEFGGRSYSASCQVSVETPSITLSEHQLTRVYVDSSVTLNASTMPSNVTVEWSCSDNSIANVSSSGTVTAVGIGEARITAQFTYGGKTYSDSCSVKTTAPVTIYYNANGGSVSPSSREVDFGDPLGSLPAPTKTGFDFKGWFTSADGGSQVDESYVCQSKDGMTIYAQWKPQEFTVSWDKGTGYTISVSRSSSQYGNASSGTLDNGSKVFYGDVLNVTYTAETGYTITGTGEKTITVSGNVGNASIFATVKANNLTYKVKYVSSNGRDLGSSTVTYAVGTTNTISAPDKRGYYTPSSQSVKWDTPDKTITFTYSPSQPDYTYRSGTVDTSPGITYSATVEYANRTANSVQLRVTWTSTIRAVSWTMYGQNFKASTNADSTGTVVVAPFNSWSKTGSARSATGTSGWITASVNTMDATSVDLSVYYFQTNANGTKMNDANTVNETWSVSIPAY